MKRRAKVELFEEIRREYEFGIGERTRSGAEAGSASAAGASSPGRCTTAGAKAARAVPAGVSRADAVH
jgi:hypothetical protein